MYVIPKQYNISFSVYNYHGVDLGRGGGQFRGGRGGGQFRGGRGGGHPYTSLQVEEAVGVPQADKEENMKM